MRLLWLADAFTDAGLVVVEEPGWQDRGRHWTDLVGLFQHHTACCMPYPVDKLYPTRPGQWRIRANFSVQPGPGNPNVTPAKIHVIAAGACNYSSGTGSGRVLRETRQDIAPSEDAARRRLVDTATGSKHFVNNETAHRGDGSPIPAPMLETIDIAWYVIAKELGLHPNRLISHAEWTRRKIDPRWNNLRSHHTMEAMRTRLTANLAGGGTPPLAGPPQEKEQTMRRGDSGQAVADLQRAAIVTHGADFGAWDPFGPGYPSGADGDYGPATESFVLDFQRTRGLEPTGGFLGPNGAGKTTTMRCLLGLVRPTAGSVRVLGADVPSELPRVIGAVGALVESPKFFPGFTGRLNLRLLADMEGYTARDVGRVLEEVGLADRADDLFSGYSLGMKQRLAVASTLLKDPELLILDEPANGLDPAGIREMRELIRQRADAGSTVFVSSHILAEVQLMCDSVAIIDRGRLVTSGTVADVLTPYRRRVVATIERRDDARRVLRDVGMPAEPTSDPFELVIDVDEGDAETVTKVLADAGLYLRGLKSEEVSLEAVFLELTGGDGEPAP